MPLAFMNSEIGFTGTLEVRSTSPSTSYGADISILSLQILCESVDTVRVRITDSAKTRWEVRLTSTYYL